MESAAGSWASTASSGCSGMPSPSSCCQGMPLPSSCCSGMPSPSPLPLLQQQGSCHKLCNCLDDANLIKHMHDRPVHMCVVAAVGLGLGLAMEVGVGGHSKGRNATTCRPSCGLGTRGRRAARGRRQVGQVCTDANMHIVCYCRNKLLVRPLHTPAGICLSS